MIEQLITNPLLWIVITIAFYNLGDYLMQKWSNPLFTPLLFAIVCLIVLLILFDIPLETYNEGGQFFSLLITPATVSLAIKLEKSIHYLKANFKAIVLGIFLGVLFHTLLIFAFAILFDFNSEMIATLIPKSITTAIAVGVSDTLGGIISLTIGMVIITGIIGAIIASSLFKLFNINHPVAQGVAIGSASHALGTTKAIELGEIQGAMSSVSIVVTGIIVVILAPLTVPITNLLFK